MKKYPKYFILIIVSALLFTGCTPGLSEEKFDTIDIFMGNHTFTFERTEGDVVNDVTYEVNLENDIVSTNVEIDFEQGRFISQSKFNAHTLIPVSAYKSNKFSLEPDKNWEITGNYGVTLEMVARTEEEQETKSMELPPYFLDNEALLFAMGAIDYAEGFSQDINVSIIDAGEIIPFKVTYMGTEIIEVPYGTYECIKVEMKYTGLVLGPKPRMYMWYTNDENRYPLMYENKDIRLRLKVLD